MIKQLKPFLKIDGQLGLHLARPELAEVIFKTVDGQRGYLREWLPWVDFTKEVKDTEHFIKESMDQNAKGTRLTTFIINAGKLAGSVGAVSFSKDHKSCEIGYWLSEELQGRGIMTKACGRFIDYLFKTKDLNRIEIKAATENKKSQAIPLRLGFKKEGTLREGLLLYNAFHDLELFSLLKSEWLEKGLYCRLTR